MEGDPKDRLHRLVDHFAGKPRSRRPTRYLEYLSERGDPLVRVAMAAPEEHEELSAERTPPPGRGDTRSWRPVEPARWTR